MSRYFAPITPAELTAKIEAVVGYDGLGLLIEHLGKDIKVAFDLENTSDGPNGFGPKPLLGVRQEPNGLTYYGFAAGGDWEHPVFFLVYWDGKKLRGYVPTDGNPWNTKTKQAYGNDDEKDFADAAKRWPEYYKDKTDEEFDSHALDFDTDKIHADFTAHILPKPA